MLLMGSAISSSSSSLLVASAILRRGKNNNITYHDCQDRRTTMRTTRRTTHPILESSTYIEETMRSDDLDFGFMKSKLLNSVIVAFACSLVATTTCPSTAVAANAIIEKQQPTYSGVDPAESALIQKLLKRTKEDKTMLDEQRLNNYYNKKFLINEITGIEVLKNPCDPRDFEFGAECRTLPTLPRLPGEALPEFPAIIIKQQQSKQEESNVVILNVEDSQKIKDLKEIVDEEEDK